jgi:hypothetical protein
VVASSANDVSLESHTPNPPAQSTKTCPIPRSNIEAIDLVPQPHRTRGVVKPHLSLHQPLVRTLLPRNASRLERPGPTTLVEARGLEGLRGRQIATRASRGLLEDEVVGALRGRAADAAFVGGGGEGVTSLVGREVWARSIVSVSCHGESQVWDRGDRIQRDSSCAPTSKRSTMCS